MDGWIKRWIVGWLDVWMDGGMDRWMDALCEGGRGGVRVV